MQNKLDESKTPSLNNVEEVLGRDLFLKLKEIEPSVMLVHTIFGYFDRCQIIKELLANFGIFLRFYERRNKFRYQLRQKLKSKNEMKTKLYACLIQKFNRYDLLRNELQNCEKKDLVPIDIVYEPTLDTEKPILCFYAPQIHLAYQRCYEKFRDGKKPH